MKKYFTILILLLSGLISFSQNQPDKNDKCDLKMNFNSAGGGIDSKAYEASVAVLKEFKATYTESNYGREGETEFCISTKGLKKKQKKELKKRLKKTAESGQLVSISGS